MKKIFLNLTALILSLNLVLNGPTLVVLAQEASPESSASPAAQTSGESSNTQTGSSSDNSSTQTSDTTTNTTNTNDSTTNNTTNADSTSGSNDASSNTGDANVNTSDSSTGTSSTTTTNTNTVQYSPMPWTTWTGTGDWTTRNQQTGSNSNNTATTDNTVTSNVTNNNTAAITNDTTAGSTTGANTASNNTGNATVTTGNASTSTSNTNVANLNHVHWTGDGDWTNLWQGEALNFMTGANSDNSAAVEFQGVIDVLNQNGVDVNNLINSFANSGANTASDNTGNATIQTGDSSVLASLFNLANTNIFGTDSINVLFQDIYGVSSQNINLGSASPFSLQSLMNSPMTLTSENNMTGSNSLNDASINGSLTLNLDNLNEGDLTNNLDLLALTGGNDASDNTGAGNITTGDASIIANLINLLNTNVITNSFYLGMINVYGDWTGNLILPEYTPTATTLASAPVISDTNSFTGSGSNNDANTNLSTNTNINNQNEGTVTGEYDLVADTGNNSASKNTLGGSVTTGNVSGQANDASFINTNVISDQPWWLVIVNNMGKWTPTLISPMLANGTQIILDLDDLDSQAANSNVGTQATGEIENTNNMTGTGSTNNAETNLTADTNISNQNTGNIINNVEAEAITGQNTADRNTGGGNISTGNASILVNALNFLNTNIVAPSFLLTFINVFGDWSGNILNYDQSLQAQVVPSPTPSSAPLAVGGLGPTNTNPTPTPSPTTTTSSNNPPSNNTSSPTPSPVSNTTATTGGNSSSGGQSSSQGGSVLSQASTNDEEGDFEGQVLAFHEDGPDDQTGGGGSSTNVMPSTIQNKTIWLIGLTTLALILASGLVIRRIRIIKLLQR